MTPGEWQLIKDQELQCKPGFNPMMWELCFSNLRKCMRDIEVMRGLLGLLTTVDVPTDLILARSTILGMQEKMTDYLIGKVK